MLLFLVVIPALPAKAKSRTIQSFFSSAQQSVASASNISERPPAPAPPPPPPAPPPPRPKTPQEVFEKNRSEYTWLCISDEDEPSLHCAQCVDDKFDTLPDNELPEKELTVLLDHFGVPKTVVPEPAAFFSEETESKFSPFHTSKRSVSKTFPALVVSEKANKDEFEMFKSHMFSSFAEYTEFDDKGQIVPLSFVEFVKRNKSSLQARFPEIFTLMQLALVLPLTSVPCECGFSKMKLIKSAMRSKMGTEVLDHLMRISCATISCVDFGIKFGVKVLDMFFQLRNRRMSTALQAGASHKLPAGERFVEDEMR